MYQTSLWTEQKYLRLDVHPKSEVRYKIYMNMTYLNYPSTRLTSRYRIRLAIFAWSLHFSSSNTLKLGRHPIFYPSWVYDAADRFPLRVFGFPGPSVITDCKTFQFPRRYWTERVSRSTFSAYALRFSQHPVKTITLYTTMQ